MSEAINNVKQAFDAELAQTNLTNQEAVNNLRVKYLGKKGAVTDLMKQYTTNVSSMECNNCYRGNK